MTREALTPIPHRPVQTTARTPAPLTARPPTRPAATHRAPTRPALIFSTATARADRGTPKPVVPHTAGPAPQGEEPVNPLPDSHQKLDEIGPETAPSSHTAIYIALPLGESPTDPTLFHRHTKGQQTFVLICIRQMNILTCMHIHS